MIFFLVYFNQGNSKNARRAKRAEKFWVISYTLENIYSDITENEILACFPPAPSHLVHAYKYILAY